MRNDLAVVLHRMVSSIAPICGVSLPSPGSKSSWRIDFDPSATPDQRAAVAKLIEDTDFDLPTLEEYSTAIDRHILGIAKARGYSSELSLAGYAMSSIPQWQSEAQSFLAWRDSVWIYVYTQLEEVRAGQRTPPSVDELVTELPSIKW